MKSLKLLILLTIIIVASFCSNSQDRHKNPQISYNGFTTTPEGDTINRINEKGKQGRWVYKQTDGSSTDTIYKNGIPQNK
jgi:hypothetical protein